MRNKYCLWILFLIVFPFGKGVFAQQSKAKANDDYANAPYDLMVEFLRKPERVLIKDKRPEYSWVVPEGAVSQSAYQILVASSKENLDNNMGDIWDSGQVRENKSSEIAHQGILLESGETYFWKVRIADQNNRFRN